MAATHDPFLLHSMAAALPNGIHSTTTTMSTTMSTITTATAMVSQQEHEESSNPSAAARPFHFFKILLPINLYDGNLRIPKKFARIYGESLPDQIFLSLPNGAEWQIILDKRDDGVWFQTGWENFVNDLSLAEGHMLMFRYEGRGTSRFHVVICDVTATEIDYT